MHDSSRKDFGEVDGPISYLSCNTASADRANQAGNAVC